MRFKNKKQLLEYLGKNKMDIANAKASVLAADLVFSAYVDSKKIHGIDFGPVLSYCREKTNFYQIISLENIMAVGRKIFNGFLKNPKSLDGKIKIHDKLSEETDTLWRKYGDKRKLSDRKLLELWDRFINFSKEWWLYGVIGEDKGGVIEENLIPLLIKNHKINLNRVNEIVNILSHPEKQAVFSRERQDFLEICLFIKSKPVIEEALKTKPAAFYGIKRLKDKISKYSKKYFYINTDFYDVGEVDSEYVLREINKEIDRQTVVSLKAELKKIKDATKEIKKNKKKILSSLTLTPEEKKGMEYAQKIVYWIDKRKIGMMKQFYYFFSLVHEMIRRRNVSYADVNCLTFDELRKLFLTGKSTNRKELTKRKAEYMVVYEDEDSKKMFYGKEAREFFEIAKKTGSKELIGGVASRGKEKTIKGIVRIVFDPASDAFKKGEILVTSMTRIEFAPLMNRAKMIITNEGGIACHAAIVSRELGVPCIIGTKNATEVLKNGDLIEANLKTGIIKKI